jgi:6-pyruvoyltetrahydropterin/6-carboxytetrahydropterin synthase
MDTKLLKKIINDAIIAKVDHRNLNVDVDFLNGVNTTSENLLFCFWNELKPLIDNDMRKLYKLQLFETENNIAEYYGE